ncbi:DUF6098 family protein [Streptomyces luteogriseus]|uniref:DUF6098 family protein n=1 Tax=Streptomyces luteogriseus TaxID=68233 RepID=UPI0033EADB8C
MAGAVSCAGQQVSGRLDPRCRPQGDGRKSAGTLIHRWPHVKDARTRPWVLHGSETAGGPDNEPLATQIEPHAQKEVERSEPARGRATRRFAPPTGGPMPPDQAA